MGAPFSVTPSVGFDLNSTVLAADIASGAARPVTILGEQVFASNGKIYVYAQANASISASTAVCAINVTTFLVAATGGSYLSPAVAMSSGDQGWFSRAGV